MHGRISSGGRERQSAGAHRGVYASAQATRGRVPAVPLVRALTLCNFSLGILVHYGAEEGMRRQMLTLPNGACNLWKVGFHPLTAHLDFSHSGTSKFFTHIVCFIHT
eukprot:4943766-Pleurochrysis_carterae.AAC.4